MTYPETSSKDQSNRPTAVAVSGETEYTVEADLDLITADGATEVEPFRATITANSVEDAVEAFQRVAHERLVDAGPFHDVGCPSYPGHGDYRFVESR